MNLAWLCERHGDRLVFVRGDIRDFDALRAAIPPDTARVYHMAGQVAVMLPSACSPNSCPRPNGWRASHTKQRG